MYWQESLPISVHTVHSHPLHYSKTSTGYPLNGEYISNWPPMAYKALHTGQPPYLSELLQYYEPTRTLRSSSSFQLSVPRHNLEFGSREFRISAPKIWNLLPASIRNSPSIPTFRRHLKTLTYLLTWRVNVLAPITCFCVWLFVVIYIIFNSGTSICLSVMFYCHVIQCSL